MTPGHLESCVNQFLMTAICSPKLRDVCIRLVHYQPFCMEVNVGHPLCCHLKRLDSFHQ